MSSFLLSTRPETAFVSGSDTGPAPQNVSSRQFLDAPIPGTHRKRQRRHHDLSRELTEGKESSSLKATGVGVGLNLACLEVSSGHVSQLGSSFEEELRKAEGLMFGFRNELQCLHGPGRKV